LSVVQGAKASKAKRIIGIDSNESKFPMALEMGCTDVVNPTKFNKPIQEVIIDMTDGGVDYSFEAIGKTSVMVTPSQITFVVVNLSISVESGVGMLS
jgi:S-(hydroxymethyl)glutathione dehydrogenase/alcohol dehydrogenase